MRISAALWAIAVIALAAFPCLAQTTPQTVKIPQGALQGTLFGGVAVFKAIPYAAPPVGPLRWRPPAPPLAWSGVRATDAFGPACIQPGGKAPDVDEDCLTLNIWAPADLAPNQKAPVIVWIHGGAFIAGSGAEPFFDGAHFAERGVVLVTINYRLGRFGFFAHPALTAADPQGPLGNYGLMDQIAALKWVKANIAAFGGDPDNVTIAGQSAGAISVDYLMISPMARGLFAKAIAQSAFGRAAVAPIRGAPRSAEAVGTRIAAALGVKGEDAAALAALRALPAQMLNASPAGLADPEIPSPMIDGKVIPETIAAGFAAGHEARVPFLEGGNSWEASLFPGIAKDPEATLAQSGDAREAAITLYGGPADLAKVATDLTTDALVTEPNRFLALALVRDGAVAWLYHFDYVPAAQREGSPGAPHAAEVMYVFDNPPAAPVSFGGRLVPAATADDRRLAEAMNAYWTRFAQASTPGAAGGAPWPRFTDTGQTVMVFGPDGPDPQPQFEKTRLDFLAAHASAP